MKPRKNKFDLDSCDVRQCQNKYTVISIWESIFIEAKIHSFKWCAPHKPKDIGEIIQYIFFDLEPE